jgi:hypothetical protein
VVILSSLVSLMCLVLLKTSSKPLSGKELQKTIRDAWEIDGIRDTQEIAQELNCSVRYVRRVLQPVRQAEKDKLKEEIVDLKKEGLSEREIAKKTGKPRTTIQRIASTGVAQNGTVPKWAALKADVQPQNNELTAAKRDITSGKSQISEPRPDIGDKPAVTSSVDTPNTPDEPPSAIPELSKYGTWKPGEKTCIRAMELARAGLDVTSIARHDQPLC